MTLSKRLADAVQRAAERAVRQYASAWMLASVTAVHGDGTVSIATGSGPVPHVRRMKSYASPVIGDVVKVSRNADGNWIVDGALA